MRGGCKGFGVMISILSLVNIVPVYGLLENDEDITEITIEETLKFTEPKVILKQNGYFKVELENCSYTLESGKPMLPVYTIVYSFPLGTKVLDVNCYPLNVTEKYIDGKILPATSPILSYSNNIFFIDKSLYNSRETYPRNWFSYHVGGGFLHEKHVAILSIHIYPLRYLPAKRILRFADEIKMSIRYVEKNILPGYAEEKLLIISPSDFLEELKPLKDYKESIGIETILVNPEEIYNATYFPSTGRDEPEKIKYFIKNAIENWNIKYVLLVGNIDKLPVRYSHILIRNSNLSFITDLYYADIYNASGGFSSWDTNNNNLFGEINKSILIDEVDLYPDIYIGRLLCNNSLEVKVLVDKIISYENEGFNQSWFKKLLVCGGDTSTGLLMSLPELFLCGGIALEGEYKGEKVIDIMKGFTPIRLYASAFIPPLNIHDAEKLTVKNINNAINSGVGFVLFSGHGDPKRWATYLPFTYILLPPPKGYYGLDDIKKLANKNKLPLMVIEGCSCGDFSKTTGCPTPFAWEFVKLETGGAIATIAATTSSVTHRGKMCIEDTSGYMITRIFEAYNQGYHTCGSLLAEAQTNYISNIIEKGEHILPFDYLTVEEYILFGDPSLKIS